MLRLGHIFYCCCLVAKWCPTPCDSVDCSPPRLLCPWDFPGKNIGMGCHFLLQGIFPTQGSNPHFLPWQNTIQPSISCFCSNQSNRCLFREAVGRGRWHWLLMLGNQEAHSFSTGVCRGVGVGGRAKVAPTPCHLCGDSAGWE